jgi:hypothetical protein
MDVEKITYQINWKKFKPGFSFFIPALEPIKARLIVLAEAKRLRYNVTSKLTIEDGVRGVRVWRVA